MLCKNLDIQASLSHLAIVSMLGARRQPFGIVLDSKQFFGPPKVKEFILEISQCP